MSYCNKTATESAMSAENIIFWYK